jgi:hypothetical protein
MFFYLLNYVFTWKLVKGWFCLRGAQMVNTFHTGITSTELHGISLISSVLLSCFLQIFFLGSIWVCTHASHWVIGTANLSRLTSQTICFTHDYFKNLFKYISSVAFSDVSTIIYIHFHFKFAENCTLSKMVFDNNWVNSSRIDFGKFFKDFLVSRILQI